MNDYEAIRRLIAIYGQLLDSGRFEEWGALFAPDATFSVWGQTFRGREEIVREIGGMQPDAAGKHAILQPVIDLEGECEARAWTDFTALSTTDDGIAVVTLGRYHDQIVKLDGVWHFASRDIAIGGETLGTGIPPTPAR
ncbi:nuclear transport factor 2 family protein [Myxococcota bacterium]|nr:nuclear transport factor 2 family protein [Myxococcota bacterium]